jgi:hypothetical protein
MLKTIAMNGVAALLITVGIVSGLLRSEEPQPSAPPVPAVDPNVWRILTQWEQAWNQVRTSDARFRRIVYDDVFAVEKRSTGRFYLQAPNQGRLDLHPVPIPPGQVGRKLDKDGIPYQLESEKSASFIWQGGRLIWIDEDEKTYEEFLLPRDRDDESVRLFGIEHPLQKMAAGPQVAFPLLVDVQARAVLQEFEITLVEQSDTQIRLSAQPRSTSQVARWYSTVDVILNPKTYLPVAVKYVDFSGSLTIMYVFNSVDVDLPPFRNGQNPLQPNLDGYTRIEP